MWQNEQLKLSTQQPIYTNQQSTQIQNTEKPNLDQMQTLEDKYHLQSLNQQNHYEQYHPIQAQVPTYQFLSQRPVINETFNSPMQLYTTSQSQNVLPVRINGIQPQTETQFRLEQNEAIYTQTRPRQSTYPSGNVQHHQALYSAETESVKKQDI